MKIKFLPLVAALSIVTPLVTSCLDNDEVVIDYGSETSITNFQLGTLKIDRIGKDKNGKDSAYVDTIDCSNYLFTIDQANRTIENKDSLPMGVHLDKVVISKIGSDTEIIGYEKNGQDTTWVSTDSIDFTVTADHALNFRVYTYDFKKGVQYKVKVNRHKQDPDSISWKDFDGMQFGGNNIKEQKAIFANKTLFVFGKKDDNTPVYYYSGLTNGNPEGWTEVNFSSVSSNDIDTYSATLWGDVIYLRTTQGGLISIDTAEPAEQTLIAGQGFEQLITGIIPFEGSTLTRFYLKKKDGDQSHYCYVDGEYNYVNDSENVEIPASKPLFSVNEPSSYNKALIRSTVLTYNNRGTKSDTCALVFHRLSTDNKWSELEPTPSSGCPNLRHLVVIPYDGKFYAFGGESQGRVNKIKPFERFYTSSDHGLTWQKAPEKQIFPKNTDGLNIFADKYAAYNGTKEEGIFSCTVDTDHFIWIIWKDGKVSRGRINRLGFRPKW